MFKSLLYAIDKKRKHHSVKSYLKAHRYTELYHDEVAGITFYGRTGDFNISTTEISIVTNHLGDYAIKQVFTSPFVMKVLKDYRDNGIITSYVKEGAKPKVALKNSFGDLISVQNESAMFDVYYYATGIKEEHFNIEAVEFTRILARGDEAITVEKFALPTQILTKWTK